MNNKAIPVLAAIIAIGIFFGYVGPTWQGEIARTKASIESYDKALEAAAAYNEQKSQLTSARSNIDKKDLDRLAVLLPDSVNNVRLILDLDALAARSGLTLSNIDVLDTTAPNTKVGTSTSAGGGVSISGNTVGSIDLMLSAVGTYSSMRSFLDGVEKSARLLDVRDVAVKGSNTGAYNYQMTVRLYWLR